MGAAKRVCWIAFSDLERRGGEYCSSIASTRYRVLIPAKWLGDQGITQTIVSAECYEQALDAAMHSDIVIFSKSNQPSNERILEEAKKSGAKVVMDICDNRFVAGAEGDHYLSMTTQADIVVANTPEMAEVVREKSGREAVVISDPYEGPKGEPVWKWKPGRRIEMLWFGHPLNLDTLSVPIPQFVARTSGPAISVRICTMAKPEYAEHCRRINREHGNRMKLFHVPWSVDQVWRELSEVDLVLIPSKIELRHKQVKSPNRMVESIWAGKFVLASPLPAHQPFSEWFPLWDDFAAGLDWVLSHQSEIVPRIRAAQDYVATHYSPEVIGKQWEAVIEA